MNYQIKYKYNLFKDFKIFLHNIRNKKFLESEKIYTIKWSLKKYLRLLFNYYTGKLFLPKIKTKNRIICYIVSSGTWGAYELPNKIFICPLELNNLDMTIESLIKHELAHLKYEHKVANMTHKEKENFINKKTVKK